MPPATCHSAKLNTGYVFSPASINSKTTQDFTFKTFPKWKKCQDA